MLVHALDGRAVSRVVLAVSGELAATGVEVFILTASRSPTDAVRVPPGVIRKDLTKGNRRTGFAILRLAQELRSLRPDVLFAHRDGPGRAAIVARALARVPTRIVAVEHSHWSTFRASSALRARLTALCYARADGVAGVSPGVVEDLEQIFPRISGRTSVLPSIGPDLATMPELGANLPHDWYAKRGRPSLICSVGNLVPRKGQDTLVEALPLIRARVPEARLILIGRHDDEAFVERLQQRAGDLGVAEHVAFLGYREDAVPFIAGADVFAFASLTEGCPMVLVEAMACGVPVVSTDCPVGPSYLLDHGKYGILVPVHDPEAMAQAIVATLTNPRRRKYLIDAGRERATAFTPAAVAQSYLALAG
jgi:glycosyltransferase involved in cell wall biosynthesis